MSLRSKVCSFVIGLVWVCSLSQAQARTKFRYPLSTSGTYITAYYDNDRGSGLRDWSGKKKTYNNHSGSDYGIGGFSGMDRGVWVVAGADGTVDRAVDGNFDRCTSAKCSPGNGNYVRIRHPDGLYSYYLHLRKGTVQVKSGQKVKCGQKLGQVGSSGYSTGPHLHFQVNGSSARDPFLAGDWVNRGSYLKHPSTSCAGTPPPVPPAPPTNCGYVKTYRLGGSGLNMRTGPSTGNSILLSIPEGTCVKVLQKNASGQNIKGDSTWYQVTYKGKTGWISGYYAQCSTCGGPAPECSGTQTRACYTGPSSTRNRGTCKDGKQTCSNGKWGSCSGQVRPAGEVCDGKDNDCDGSTDEGNPGGGKACTSSGSGSCANGTTRCQGGRIICQSGASSAEVCDGKDNNCNGQIDEGNPGAGKTCKTGQSGACSDGSTVCKSGRTICQAVTKGSPETCDNVDNNCNGQVDDGLSRNCYTGPPNTNGTGLCKGGKQVCRAGKWGSCQGEIKPAKQETCGNSKDDNCNGQVDEGCNSSCKAGQTQPCYTGPSNTRNVGVCKEGSQQCVNGVWGTCQGVTSPAPAEVCNNGKDDNCDGTVDEGCSAPQGRCEDKDGDGYGVGDTCKGTQDCNDNNDKVKPGASEVCGNGIDEDCDGRDLPCGKLKVGEEGCNQPSDCESNFCVKLGEIKRCSQPCTKDSDCSNLFTCINKQACWPRKKRQIPPSDFAKPCKDSTSCPNGQSCEKGFCIDKSGCGCSTTPKAPHLPPFFLLLLFALTALQRKRHNP